MPDVSIVGVGMTRFGKRQDRTIEQLGQEAALAALADSGASRGDIDEIFCGSSFGGPLIGQRIFRELGMTGKPITNVENACSSSASAVREAIAAIETGRAETVMVVGIDQLTRLGGGTLPIEPNDVEGNLGVVMPAVYAMRAKRYLHETGATQRDLAEIVVKSRQNGALNPNAQTRETATVEQVLASRPVADPLTLFMCCPTGDGAAAVVLTSTRKARNYRGSDPVRICASILTSGLYKTGFRDMAYSELTADTAREAYEAAGIGPEDLDLVETHDAFVSAELMYSEALGLCERGGGVDLFRRGDTRIGGRSPVNPSGGLLCRGHPVGATGVAQIVESTRQLRGEAGALQVEGARTALTHCTGGGISGLDHGACAVHVLAR